jgi:glycosyltransferase involved in cell wall biosynthesis
MTMRIVIDLQGAQSVSRDRGIGRYSLALALAVARNREWREVFILLSDLFPETIAPLRTAFHSLLPRDNIRVWRAHGPTCAADERNADRRAIAEAIRDAAMADLRPDIVLVASPFEGWGDNALSMVKKSGATQVASVLYDLIPHVRRKDYLSERRMMTWYDQILSDVTSADLLLAISQSSQQEAIDHIHLPPARVAAISGAADPRFKPIPISESDLSALREAYGISRPFVMYTGGIDPRKNIEGLIRAYASLAMPSRAAHQLVVVCAVRPTDEARLSDLASQAGLQAGEFVLTGYVPDEALVVLYNACRVFVFPSLHEGFGLPALEAMQCGRAVIASNTSSLPEVVGLAEALFDPTNEEAICAKLERALTDDGFRSRLEKHGLTQASRFSWDETARRAIAAMDDAVGRAAAPPDVRPKARRPRLAYVSPLPPEQSGISFYSAELLPFLAQRYEIDVIVNERSLDLARAEGSYSLRGAEWFKSHFAGYDRIVYQFGGSVFHKHMVDLLEVAPGAVVLHDFYLYGAHVDRSAHAWSQALLESHGYRSVVERLRSPAKALVKYPGNLRILQNALGIIVHSEHSRRLAEQWYGARAAEDWVVIPQLRTQCASDPERRLRARARLGVPCDALLICSFGRVAPTKLNDRLVDAFLASRLADEPHVHLIFVGDLATDEYGRRLLSVVAGCGLEERIRFCGWTDDHAFEAHLDAADIAVQLRTESRGESSRAMLDCLSRGLPTIVNANGSMAEAPADGVWMLPDEFTQRQLASALERLAYEEPLRRSIGERGRAAIGERHAPEACAARYFDAIEAFHSRDQTGIGGAIGGLARRKLSPDEIRDFGSALSATIPPRPRLRQLLVDVTGLVGEEPDAASARVAQQVLRSWLANPPRHWNVEPVCVVAGGYRYARRWTCALLEIQSDWASDELVDAWPGDVILELVPRLGGESEGEAARDVWRRMGVEIVPVLAIDGFARIWNDAIGGAKPAVALSPFGLASVKRGSLEDQAAACVRSLEDWLSRRDGADAEPHGASSAQTRGTQA